MWFTSDHHFGHRKVSEIRGFATPAHHNLEIVKRHNDLVKPDDVVYMLGDLSAGSSSATYDALGWVNRMNGRKRLIAGNHDPIHPMHRASHGWYPAYMAASQAFESVAPFGRASVLGIKVLLSHFPYHVDRDEPRYTQWRLRDEGEWLLHGHLHTDRKITSGTEIHVGLDSWDLSPVSADKIYDFIK